MQSGDGFGGIEDGAPRERQREQREQHTQVRPGVRVRVRQPTTEPQRADPDVQQGDDHGGGAHPHQRELPEPLAPGQPAQVVAQVPLEHGVRNAEDRRAGGERRRHPPVPRAERQEESEHQTAGDRAGEEQGLRHRLDDLQVTEPARQLHRADGAVHEQEIRRAPGDCPDEQQPRHEPGEVPGGEIRAAAEQACPPGAFGCLQGEPASTHEHRDQQSDCDEQRSPADDGLHAPGLCAASQLSISVR